MCEVRILTVRTKYHQIIIAWYCTDPEKITETEMSKRSKADHYSIAVNDLLRLSIQTVTSATSCQVQRMALSWYNRDLDAMVDFM